MDSSPNSTVTRHELPMISLTRRTAVEPCGRVERMRGLGSRRLVWRATQSLWPSSRFAATRITASRRSCGLCAPWGNASCAGIVACVLIVVRRAKTRSD